MKELSNYIKSDLYKLWHSSFFIVHIVFLIMAVLLVHITSIFTKQDGNGMLFSFFQLLGIGFPFAISIATYVMVDQEVKTSKSQNLLILPNRCKVILSKFIIAVVTGFIIVELGTIIMNLFVTTTESMDGFIRSAPIILILTNVFNYVIFIFIAFRCGKSFSIILGVVGSLLSVLLRTGLGAGIWHIIPFGWGSNMLDISIGKFIGIDTSTLNIGMNITEVSGLILSITVLGILGMLIWFYRYDGRTMNE